MEKINRWFAMHSVALLLLACSVIGCLGGYLMLLDVTPWIVYPLIVLAVNCAVRCISRASVRLLKKPLAQLHHDCDPYPILDEIKLQQSYPGNERVKQIRIINYATALREIGEYEKARMLMESINVDKCANMPMVFKVIYYNNRMDLCVLTGKTQEALIWYGKAMQIYHDMKPGKAKTQLNSSLEINRALHHFCNGDYSQTLRILEMVEPKHLQEKIEINMLSARTYLAMGELEQARNRLRYVAQNGNKLYFATEARALLEKINMEA